MMARKPGSISGSMLLSRSTLPNVLLAVTKEFAVREISTDKTVHESVWEWHRRRPGFDESAGVGPEHYLGDRWRNYLFSFDSIPKVGISVNEREAFGYEIHVAVAPGTKPKETRVAVRWIGDLLTRHDCRIISYFPKEHKAAKRLNREFLTYEAQVDVDGVPWVRYATTAKEWRERFKEDVET